MCTRWPSEAGFGPKTTSIIGPQPSAPWSALFGFPCSRAQEPVLASQAPQSVQVPEQHAGRKGTAMLVSDVLPSEGRDVVRIGADDSIALAMRRLAERHIDALVGEDRPDDRSADCYGRRASIHRRSGSACRDRFRRGDGTGRRIDLGRNRRRSHR